MDFLTKYLTGEWKDGKPYIYGVYSYRDGSRYCGEFKDLKRHGRGKFSCYDADESVYEGEWKDGKKHGHGCLQQVNEVVYEGEWKDGKMHGHGKFSGYADKSVYEGEWKHGRKHGPGVLTLSNGEEYHGAWKNGQWHGYGVVITNGEDSASSASPGYDKYEGEWVSRELHAEMILL